MYLVQNDLLTANPAVGQSFKVTDGTVRILLELGCKVLSEGETPVWEEKPVAGRGTQVLFYTPDPLLCHGT